MNRPVLATVTAVLISTGSLAAVEKEQQFAPMVLGPETDSQPWYDLGAKFELQNKHVDNGLVRNNEPVGHAEGVFRIYGAGIQLDGYFVAAPDTRAGVNNSVGEVTQITSRLDYLMEVPFVAGVPMVQIDPYLEWTTYPDQPSEPRNYLKTRQIWAGLDSWVSPPFNGFEGVEFGGGLAWNLGEGLPMFRGSVGSRQFYQLAPLDFALFQLLNFGNRHYHGAFMGTDTQGATTIDIGGRLTVPLIHQDWWGFMRIEGQYWLGGDDRENAKRIGQGSGDLEIGIGIEWRPSTRVRR